MPIRVSCPECDQQYQLKDELAGKKVRCKKCQDIISVPAAKAVVAQPKVEYDDEYEDYEFKVDDQDEHRSQRIKRLSNAKRAKPKKERRIAVTAKIDKSKVTFLATVGGILYIVNTVISINLNRFNPLFEIAMGIMAISILALIGGIILKIALKLMTKMDLPFGDSCIASIAMALATGGVFRLITDCLIWGGLHPRRDVFLLISIFIGLVLGLPAYFRGICITHDDGERIGFVKGLLVLIPELIVGFAFTFALYVLFFIVIAMHR